MGTIREIQKKDGTKSYHAEIRVRGAKPQRASFRTRSLAKKWVQDTESAIRDGRHFRVAEAKKHTVSELVDRFIESEVPKYPAKYQAKQKALLVWWREQLGHLLLADIVQSPALLSECRDKLLNGTTHRKTQRTGSTVNRYIAAFSKALSVAHKDWGWIEENPLYKISKPSESKGRTRFLSEDEIKRLIYACGKSPNVHLYPIVSLALFTGMRLGEITGLRWKDIDFTYRTITLETTKNGDRRVIPLTEEMEALLKSCPTYGTTKDNFVFKSRYRAHENRPAGIRHAFAKALEAAGIEKDFVFHLLRHTACSHMAMAGATQGELQILLGHKSPNITAKYRHFSQKHIADLMQRTYSKLLKREDYEADKAGDR